MSHPGCMLIYMVLHRCAHIDVNHFNESQRDRQSHYCYLSQLTDKEKNKLTTFLEFKNNISKILEAFSLGVKNFIKFLNFLNFDKNNQNTSPKKWVRNDKNDNIKV